MFVAMKLSSLADGMIDKAGKTLPKIYDNYLKNLEARSKIDLLKTKQETAEILHPTENNNDELNLENNNDKQNLENSTMNNSANTNNLAANTNNVNMNNLAATPIREDSLNELHNLRQEGGKILNRTNNSINKFLNRRLKINKNRKTKKNSNKKMRKYNKRKTKRN